MQIYDYFPLKIREVLEDFLSDDEYNNYISLEEIRIRANRPIILKFNLAEKILKYIVSQEEIEEILQYICENSIYSYQNQIANGFITVKGGHRVGISGSCVTENNKIINRV